VHRIHHATMSLECHNAAFEEDQTGEILRIIRELADRIKRDGLPTTRERGFEASYALRDINGNTVGYFATLR
jgi:hypothetical protein